MQVMEDIKAEGEGLNIDSVEITNMEKVTKLRCIALHIAMRSFKKRLWSDSLEEDVEVEDEIPAIVLDSLKPLQYLVLRSCS